MKWFQPNKSTRLIGYSCSVIAVPVLLFSVMNWNEGGLIVGSIMLVLGVVLTYKPEELDG